MERKLNARKDHGNTIKMLILGMGTCVVVMLVSVALISTMVAREIINESNAVSYTLCVHFLTVVAGCGAAIVKYKGNNVKCSLLLGTTYLVVMLLLNVLWFDARFQGIPNAIIVVLTGCMMSTILFKSRVKVGKTRRSKKRRC